MILIWYLYLADSFIQLHGYKGSTRPSFKACEYMCFLWYFSYYTEQLAYHDFKLRKECSASHPMTHKELSCTCIMKLPPKK